MTDLLPLPFDKRLLERSARTRTRDPSTANPRLDARRLASSPSRPDRYHRHRMLPTIAWQDDDIVMVDQRKLPAAEIYVTLQDRQRRRQGDQDDGDSRRAGDRRGRGDGPGARRGAQQGHRHQAVRDRVPEDLRPAGGDAADRGQPVLGDRAHEARVCRRRAGRRIGRRAEGAAARRGRSHPRRGRGELPRDRRARRRAGAGRRAHPDALQCRRAGDGRLRHRARRDPRRGRSRARRCACSPTRRGRSCRARG